MCGRRQVLADLAGILKKPFAEQVEFFRRKLNLPTEHWDDILMAAHDRAFIVAGAAKADLLADLRTAVDAAIAEGKSIGWFRKEFDGIVGRHGWQYRGERDWRTRVIYTTNMASSYAAGRWRQLNDPDLKKVRPYWQYVHNDSVLHPRPLHLSWNGLTLPADDAFWRSHYPPNGWGCRCRVVAVRGPVPGNKTEAPDDGTWTKLDRWGNRHEIPKGIDYGWDYAPGRSTANELAGLAQEKAASLAERDGGLARRYVSWLNEAGIQSPKVRQALSVLGKKLGAQ
jgi:uncharacterized protein with gpF-like domain